MGRFFFYKVGDFKSLEQGVRLNKKENKQKKEHMASGRDGKKLTGNQDLSKISKKFSSFTLRY